MLNCVCTYICILSGERVHSVHHILTGAPPPLPKKEVKRVKYHFTFYTVNLRGFVNRLYVSDIKITSLSEHDMYGITTCTFAVSLGNIIIKVNYKNSPPSRRRHPHSLRQRNSGWYRKKLTLFKNLYFPEKITRKITTKSE